MKPTIALAIIAKDEVELVQSIVKRFSKYFDKVYILADKFELFDGVAGEGIVVKKYKWSDEEKEFGGIFFDRKRTELAKFITEDYYFRLDTDDEIIRPENISKVLENMHKGWHKICYTEYDYARDSFGNVTHHRRETIVRHDGSSFWNKHIHENLLPVKEDGFTCMETQDIEIKHHIDEEHCHDSIIRNLKYLLYEYGKDKENTDPRTLAYLARTYFGLGKFPEAIHFFQRHIQKSGWNHDRFFSWTALADIYRITKDYKSSIAAAMEALQECPEFPDGYLKMADAYFDQSNWKKAIEWTEMGMSRKMPKTMMVINMADYTWKPLTTLAFSYFMQSKFKEAYEYLLKAKKFAPGLDVIEKNEKLFLEGYENSLFTEHFAWLAKYYEDKDKDKIQMLLESVPKTVESNELIIGLKRLYNPPTVWGDKSVVIFCGAVAEQWSPKSMEKGIGGSEEAVIRISEQLHKLGYEVTVYNDCGEDEGNYGGIEYKSFTRFNPKDKFNIFISWRMNICDAVDAKNKVFWIHDMPNPVDLTESKCRQTDHIIVLSQYHKSLLPETVPQEKVFVSTNGIVPEDFSVTEGIEREPYRMIYASSYDRGLETILNRWKEIKTAIPQAELHIFYGWNTYDFYLDKGMIKDGGAWKNHMNELMKQEGITDHGRVGHKELLKEYAKSSYFVYPGEYAGEINCIAFTKAVGCGCFPVTNDFSVLPERNTMGVIAPTSSFVPSLITVVRDRRSSTVDRASYIKENSWEMVAKDWSDNVFPYPDTEVKNRVQFIWENIGKDDKVADIGCQDGHIFKGTPIFENVTHVDLDDFGLPNYVKADATKLPFEDKSFDVVVLAEILEHIPSDPIPAIKEALRVAKKVIITVPYEYEWDDEKKPFMGREGRELPSEYANCKDLHKEDNLEHLWHCRFYTPELLNEHIEKAGCKKASMVKLRYNSWSHLGAILYA